MDSADQPQAPARTRPLLQTWAEEFIKLSSSDPVRIKVAIQDGSDGRDTGLVLVHLDEGAGEIYMQPTGIDEVTWEITLTARPQDLTLSPYRMSVITSQLNFATNLCAFLQFKSLEWDRMSGMH